MRKRILQEDQGRARSQELNIPAIAQVHITSESADHPIENAFDGRRGPGATRWVAGQPGEQTIIVEFDEPQSIQRATLEIEETDVGRTQELTLAASFDGGETYRELLRQEYNFSPSGSTFQKEEWQVRTDGVTHLRLWIKPEKGGGPNRAKLTSLTLE